MEKRTTTDITNYHYCRDRKKTSKLLQAVSTLAVVITVVDGSINIGSKKAVTAAAVIHSRST